MRKILINVMVICLSVLFGFSLIGCRNTANKVPTDKIIEQTIQEKLENITHPKDIKIKLSSNPYDYIRGGDGNKDYKYIVSQGKKSLNYMLKKFANNDTNSFEEYIMAIACSEILRENTETKKWDTVRGWYNNYVKTNE